jgi:hypothetical protein
MMFEPEVVSVYDPKDPKFIEIREKADADGQSGCAYGVEFLLFLTDSGRFCSLFCGNISLRREASVIKAIYDKQARNKDWLHAEFKVEFVKNRKGQSWHTGKAYESPTVPNILPDMTSLETELNKFNNPPKNEVAENVSTGRD